MLANAATELAVKTHQGQGDPGTSRPAFAPGVPNARTFPGIYKPWLGRTMEHDTRIGAEDDTTTVEAQRSSFFAERGDVPVGLTRRLSESCFYRRGGPFPAKRYIPASELQPRLPRSVCR